MNRYLPDVAESTVAPTAAPTDPLYVLKQSAEKLLFEFEIPKDDWLRLMAEAGNADDYLGGLSDRVAYCDKLRTLCLAEVAKRIPERIRQAAMDRALERSLRNGWGGEAGVRNRFIDRCRPLFGWRDICITDEICKALGLSTIRDLEYWPTNQDEAFRRVADYAKEHKMDKVFEARIDQIRALFNPIWEKHGIDLLRAPWDTVNKYCKLAFAGRDWENIITSAKPEDTPEALAQNLDAYLTNNPPEKPAAKTSKKSAPAEKVEPKKGDEIPFDLDASKLKGLPGVKDEADDALEASSSPDIEAAGDTGHDEPEKPQQPASARQEPPKIVDHPPMEISPLLLSSLKKRAKEMVLAVHADYDDVQVADWLKATLGYETMVEAIKALGEKEVFEEISGKLAADEADLTTKEIVLPPQPERKAEPPSSAMVVTSKPVSVTLIEQKPTGLTTSSWFKSLSPSDFAYGETIADYAIDTGLYKQKFPTKAEMMWVIIKGLTYNVEPTAALDAISLIPDGHGGKTIFISPKLLKAIMEDRKMVRRFEVAGDDERCTVVIQAWNHETPNVFTYTIEDATKQGLAGKDNWKKMPARMLMWRAIGIAIDAECPQARYIFAGTANESESADESTMTPDELAKSVAVTQ